MSQGTAAMQKHALWNKARWVLAAVLLIAAWMVAWIDGPARDAMQFFAFLAALSAASLLVRPGSAISTRQMVAVFVVAVALGTAVSLGTHVLLHGMLFWAALAVMALGWVWGQEARHSVALRQVLLFAVAIAGLLNAIVGLFQWFGISDVLWPYVYVPEVRGLAIGALRQRNLFATQMVVTLISLLWLRDLGRISTSLAVLALTLCAAAISASTSRIGLLEVVAVALLVWVLYRRGVTSGRNAALLFFAAVLAVLSIYVWAEIAQSLGFGYAATTQRLADTGGVHEGRPRIWLDALGMIQARPWFGWGWMEYGYGYYVAAPVGSGFEYPTNAHDLYLQIAVELGVPAALLVLAVTVMGAWKWWGNVIRHARMDDGLNAQSQNVVMGGLIVIAIGMHSVVEFPLWHYSFLFIATVAWVLATSSAPAAPTGSASGRPVARRLTSVIALLLVLGVGAAWVDYQKILAIHHSPWGDVEKKKQAIADAQDVWLFRDYLDYEVLFMTPITKANASAMKARLESMLHFTQGPSIIERLILVNDLLGNADEARWHAQRYQRLYTKAYQAWVSKNPQLAARYGAQRP